mgnify:CR=1 FL=1
MWHPDSPNHYDDVGYPYQGIVLHCTSGPPKSYEDNLASTLAWFRNPASQVSAHYVIARTGLVHQTLSEELRAWHAGVTEKWLPSWALLGVNFNHITLGIELVGWPDDPYSDGQYVALERLLRHLCRKYSIPYNRDYIIPHSALTWTRTDPGEGNFDWSQAGL